MIRTHEHLNPQPQPTQTGRTDRHPAWCDRSQYTADPASQAGGHRSDGGEHRSAPALLNLTTGMRPPVRDGTAWLSETCAPWPSVVFPRVHVGDVDVSMSTDYAAPVIDALSALLASATAAPEVTR